MNSALRIDVLERVLGLAGLAELLLVAVDLRIADVVPDEPVRVCEQEDGPLAVSRVPEGPRGRSMDGLDILSVHRDRVHPVGGGALAQIRDWKLLARGCRLRPVVVLADEDGRNLPELGEVERLVEGADIGCPVAEEGDRDPRLAAQLEGERRAGDRGKPAA